jgi:hypothetical protein
VEDCARFVAEVLLCHEEIEVQKYLDRILDYIDLTNRCRFERNMGIEVGPGGEMKEIYREEIKHEDGIRENAAEQ